MSTVPGSEAWRDAGLEELEEVPSVLDTSLGDEVEEEPDEHETDEYRPHVARPDRDGEANVADVVEQALEVSDEDEVADEPEPM
ncbi:hypothetical protein L1785_04620 [Antribacter sp. KLBMP9083]|uniref:Uncharacterized protein n=1 Tax=Antribacter soli TaxID=2910976 RepID=A0AA41QB82_9MICO|nr:hypothetical protein [Antribacter soli]MCF4120258.1 hypothetical protein [Antribacter soli]